VKLVGQIDRISAGAFADFERAGRPAVIEGALRDWPALTRWTPAYLTQRIGDVEIRYKQSSNGKHPNFHEHTLAAMFATGRSTFRELFAAIATGPERLFTGDEKFLLRRRAGVTTIDPELAPLLDDIVMPALVPPDRLYTMWAWFSGRGVRTWLHYDNNGCHNLNAQIAGTKECVLIAPRELDKLALFPLGGDNPAHNCSAIDVSEPDPRLANVAAVSARVEAGDLLFIPAWWLHAFTHVGDFNANINYWWKPEHPVMNEVAARQLLIDAVANANVDE
jgi:lysine-specific demethylase 8